MRARVGASVVTMAECCTDRGARASTGGREGFMQRAVSRVSRKLLRSHHRDLSNLGRFEVFSGGISVPASEFVSEQREMHRVEINESDDSEATENRCPSALPPETFRAKGQTGLEQFGVEE